MIPPNAHRAAGFASGPQRKVNLPLLVAIGVGFLLVGVGLALSLMKLAGH